MQCLHVVFALTCQTDSEPEFRYIMPLAAETDPWTDKLLRSILRLRHTREPEFRYIKPCSAEAAKLSCPLLSYANQAVLVAVDRNLQLRAVLHSPANVQRTMLTMMQRFHVVYQNRCRAKFEPEFPYIMSLVVETNTWTNKRLLSFSEP